MGRPRGRSPSGRVGGKRSHRPAPRSWRASSPGHGGEHPARPLRAGLRPRWGRTRWPPAGADNPQAIPVLADVRRALVGEGRGLTGEAVRTPRARAARRVPGGGDAVRRVNGPPPQLPPARQWGYQAAHAWAAPVTTAARGDRGHGRRAPRPRTTRAALVGSRAGPGLAYVAVSLPITAAVPTCPTSRSTRTRTATSNSSHAPGSRSSGGRCTTGASWGCRPR